MRKLETVALAGLITLVLLLSVATFAPAQLVCPQNVTLIQQLAAAIKKRSTSTIIKRQADSVSMAAATLCAPAPAPPPPAPIPPPAPPPPPPAPVPPPAPPPPPPVVLKARGTASCAGLVCTYSDSGSTGAASFEWRTVTGLVAGTGSTLVVNNQTPGTRARYLVAIDPAGKRDSVSISATSTAPSPPAPAPSPAPSPAPAPLPPPVGGNQCGANEPAGMTWRNTRDFNAKVENGWQDRGDPTFVIVQDSTAPVSPPNVGVARYPTNFVSGSGPINTWIVPPAGIRTLYFCYWLKLDPAWWTNDSGMEKEVFFNIGGGNRVYTGSRSVGNCRLNTPPTCASDTKRLEIDFQGMDTSGGNPISWNGYPNTNIASDVLPRGSWVRAEGVLIANTPGVFDGQAYLWINGVLVVQYTKIGYSKATETGALNTWQALVWNPTFGGGGANVPYTMELRFDHFYASGKP